MFVKRAPKPAAVSSPSCRHLNRRQTPGTSWSLFSTSCDCCGPSSMASTDVKKMEGELGITGPQRLVLRVVEALNCPGCQAGSSLINPPASGTIAGICYGD